LFVLALQCTANSIRDDFQLALNSNKACQEKTWQGVTKSSHEHSIRSEHLPSKQEDTRSSYKSIYEPVERSVRFPAEDIRVQEQVQLQMNSQKLIVAQAPLVSNAYEEDEEDEEDKNNDDDHDDNNNGDKQLTVVSITPCQCQTNG
jgi:hypothetical protein